MINAFRRLVSADRNRFQLDGFDLDLSYITDKIIAMSFPSEGVNSVWRNHIDSVKKFLNTKHGEGNYMIWNCCEIGYDASKFDNMIMSCPFADHHAPPLLLLFGIVKSIDAWLSADARHAAVVHCKGGKGRTGVVICCWLFYSYTCSSILDASKLFAARRSSEERGVTQPSQRRYLSYFAAIISSEQPVVPKPRRITMISASDVPDSVGMVYIEVLDYASDKMLFTGPMVSVADSNVVEITCWIDIVDDVLLRFICRKDKTELFHLIFHPFFIREDIDELKFERKDLDTPRLIGKQCEIKVTLGKAIKESDHSVLESVAQAAQEMRKVFAVRSNNKVRRGFLGSHRTKQDEPIRSDSELQAELERGLDEVEMDDVSSSNDETQTDLSSSSQPLTEPKEPHTDTETKTQSTNT